MAKCDNCGKEIDNDFNNDLCNKCNLAEFGTEIKAEIEIIGWRTKRDSQKRISLIIYGILQETHNRHLMQREDMVNDITENIVDLAIEDL